MASWSPVAGFPRRAMVSLALVVAIVVVTFVGVNVLVQMKLGAANRVGLTLAGSPSGGGGNFLMVGSDTRSFVASEGDETAFGDEGDAGGQRSDTIMVLHVDPDSSRSLLVSFPRDLWVDIPGKGGSKINAAFNDGPQAIIDTLQSNFDVPIQHYVEVNFASFRDLVDAVGSVPVFFPAPARDEVTGFFAGAFGGCVQLDGQDALAFVRSRHLEIYDATRGKFVSADAIPDLGRIERQQAFLRELGREAMDTALSNPLKGNDIVDSAISSLTLDDDFGRGDVFSLVDAFASGSDDAAGGPETLTLPTEPATRGGQSVLIPTGEADAMLQRLRDFDTVVPDAPEESDLAPDEVKVRVLNGSGAEGAASKALAELTALGFDDGGTTNASKTFSTTEVHYRPGDDDKAALLAGFVTGPVELVEDDGVDNADVWLVLGRSFSGISQPAATPNPGTDTPSGDPQAGSLAPVPGPC